MAAIYFKTRQASREFAQKRKGNGFPASIVDGGKGWGMLRYGVSLTPVKIACNARQSVK